MPGSTGIHRAWLSGAAFAVFSHSVERLLISQGTFSIPFRAVVQTARSAGWEQVEASPPVLGAAAAQDEALGEKVFQRQYAGETGIYRMQVRFVNL